VPPYRLDFAIPDKRFGIEVDGLAYHNGQESFIKDRKRQRQLEHDGWRIIRFAAKEVMEDAHGCIVEAARLAGAP
jgi:very-short-patch-repair endonuclease